VDGYGDQDREGLTLRSKYGISSLGLLSPRRGEGEGKGEKEEKD